MTTSELLFPTQSQPIQIRSSRLCMSHAPIQRTKKKIGFCCRHRRSRRTKGNKQAKVNNGNHFGHFNPIVWLRQGQSLLISDSCSRRIGWHGTTTEKRCSKSSAIDLRALRLRWLIWYRVACNFGPACVLLLPGFSRTLALSLILPPCSSIYFGCFDCTNNNKFSPSTQIIGQDCVAVALLPSAVGRYTMHPTRHPAM